MRFGPDRRGVGMGFHLRRIQNGQTTLHLHCAHDGKQVQNLSCSSVGESEESVRFAEFSIRLMRSYCWLSWCPLECSASEREMWTHWLQEREDSGRGKATNTLEWEVQRIATAFGVDEVTMVRRIWGVHYEGLCGDVPVTWEIGDPNARVKNIYAGDRSYCGVFLSKGQWEFEPGQEGHEQIARGIYCLGIEKDEIWEHLPALTAHDKLELRLSMPREFWPQKWIDEG